MEPFQTPISMSGRLIPYGVIGTPTPWMDSRIWSRLPQRLLDRIIACLPPPAFFRARAVCKRWYALVFSNAFLDLYLQISSARQPYFIFFSQQTLKNSTTYMMRNPSDHNNNNNHRANQNQQQEGYLFDPQALRWYRIPFPLIPPGFSPAASSGGLVCWVSDDSGSKNILLSNPLLMMMSGSVLQLPPTLRPRLCPSVGFTVTDSSIDLALAGDDLISPYAVKNLSSESFHVDGGGFYSIWGRTAALPRLCSLESSGRMVHVGGRFYCMNYSPYSVLAYDVSRNEWRKIQAPMRRFLRSPSLVESRGKLMLVAAVEKSKLNVPKSLRMWALQEEEEGGGAWVEMERMPQQLYNEFGEVEGGRGFRCVGQGEVVLMLINDMKPAAAAAAAVLFDARGKRWVWVPPCPYIINNVNGEDDDDDQLLQGFCYEPRLAVPITALLQHLTHLHPTTPFTTPP